MHDTHAHSKPKPAVKYPPALLILSMIAYVSRHMSARIWEIFLWDYDSHE